MDFRFFDFKCLLLLKYLPGPGVQTALENPRPMVTPYLSNPQLRPPYASQEYIMSFEKPCLTCTYEVELFAR